MLRTSFAIFFLLISIHCFGDDACIVARRRIDSLCQRLNDGAPNGAIGAEGTFKIWPLAKNNKAFLRKITYTQGGKVLTESIIDNFLATEGQTLDVVSKEGGHKLVFVFTTGGVNCAYDVVVENRMIRVFAENHPIQKTDPTPVVDSKIYDRAEQMPRPAYKIEKYIAERLLTPANIINKNIEANIRVNFVVMDDGSIGDVSLANNVTEECDGAAYKLVKYMPNWMPGRQNGQIVKTKQSVTVRFANQITQNTKDDAKAIVGNYLKKTAPAKLTKDRQPVAFSGRYKYSEEGGNATELEFTQTIVPGKGIKCNYKLLKINGKDVDKKFMATLSEDKKKELSGTLVATSDGWDNLNRSGKLKKTDYTKDDRFRSLMHNVTLSNLNFINADSLQDEHTLGSMFVLGQECTVVQLSAKNNEKLYVYFNSKTNDLVTIQNCDVKSNPSLNYRPWTTFCLASGLEKGVVKLDQYKSFNGLYIPTRIELTKGAITISKVNFTPKVDAALFEHELDFIH